MIEFYVIKDAIIINLFQPSRNVLLVKISAFVSRHQMVQAVFRAPPVAYSLHFNMFISRLLVTTLSLTANHAKD